MASTAGRSQRAPACPHRRGPRTHRAGGRPDNCAAWVTVARTSRQSSFRASDASVRASASRRVIGASSAADAPRDEGASSVTDARVTAVRDGSLGRSRRMAPRRAFGAPWLHRTWRACGGCGPRDGPAVAPEAALCGRAHDVAVAAPNAALMLDPNDRRYPDAVKVKKRRLFSFVDYMTDRHTVFCLCIYH